MMTKNYILIIIILLPINYNLNSRNYDNNYIGSYLNNLKITELLKNDKNKNLSVIKEYDSKRNIYVVNVLKQDLDNTCGRHSIKNLIYFINAINQPNEELLKQELKFLYDKELFDILNLDFCNYNNIKNDDLTFPHKFFGVLTNFEIFLNNYTNTKDILPINYKKIISYICPIPLSLDKNNIPVISNFTNDMFIIQNNQLLNFIEGETRIHLQVKEFYKKYLLNNKITTKNNVLFKNIFPSDEFKKIIDDFKKSKQNILGLILLLPVKRTFGHWIGLVIRKISDKLFEFFILDSEHNMINHNLKNSLDTLLKVLK